MIMYWYTKTITYWLRIGTGNKSTLVNALYQDNIQIIEDVQKCFWCWSVKILLFEIGLGDVW